MPEFSLDSAIRRRLPAARGYLAIIAAVIVAAMMASHFNDSAHAAEKPPTVTWTRTVTSAGGRNLCQYNATVTTTPGQASKGMVQAAALFVAVDFERPSDGTVVLHSKAFVCSASAAGAAPSPGPAGSPTPGPAGSPTPANDSATNLEPAGWNEPATAADVKVTPVSFADVRADAASNSRLAQWILGAVIGVLAAALVAVLGAGVIIAAGAAVGVTITGEVAAVAAACLGGAAGGAIGEFVKGNAKPQIATSAIVGCAGGTFISKFTNLLQARAVVGSAAADLAGLGANATQTAAQTTLGGAIELAELAPEANAVREASSRLSDAVRTELAHSGEF